jgi:hypothetical protein
MPARVRSAVHHHRYCTLRFALHWLRSSVNPRSLSPLTDVDITYGPISPVFLSSAMVKMYVFVDWACTFLKDEAMILYLLYTGYVRISILTSKWVAMAVRDR